MKLYENRKLGFRIRYPEEWEAMPAPWMRNYLNSSSGTSEQLAEIIKKSSAPFLLIRDPASEPGVAIPTVQCKAHPISVLNGKGVRALLEKTQHVLRGAFSDLEVLELNHEYLVAGVLGSRMLGTMTVLNHEGEAFHALSELLVLPSRRWVFLVGLTATSDPAERPEREFLDIVRSIRLQDS